MPSMPHQRGVGKQDKTVGPCKVATINLASECNLKQQPQVDTTKLAKRIPGSGQKGRKAALSIWK